MARCPQFEHRDQPMQTLLEENHGHINFLPDDLLIRIISELPIRDAVVTGGVSTRWRPLWKHITNINLYRSSVNLKGELHEARFAGVMRSILRHHCGLGVNKFMFNLPLTGCCHSAELDQVMEFAAAAGTQDLAFLRTIHQSSDLFPTIHQSSDHTGPPYEFPHWRFAGGHLQKLLLYRVGLTMAPERNQEGLAQLKYLYLSRVTVDDSTLANILSTCGALITLYLQECQQLVHLNMSHTRLRELGVGNCSNLKSMTIQSSTLNHLVYEGHKIDIEYSHTLAVVKLYISLSSMENECPLDCVGSAGALPNLKELCLEFPSPLHATTCTQLQGVQQNCWFGGLSRIMLRLMTPWKEHISSVAYLLVATPSVKELQVETYNYNIDDQSPPNNLVIQWPERCLLKKLQSIIIGGFSGEAELMELIFFLLQRSPVLQTLAIDTHMRYLYFGSSRWYRMEGEDHVRCYYARGVVWTNLVPKIPSTVKFTII